MRLPGLCVGILTACQAAAPPAREVSPEPAARAFPEPRLGLHLLDALPTDEPRRNEDQALLEWLRHPWSSSPAPRLPFPAPTPSVPDPGASQPRQGLSEIPLAVAPAGRASTLSEGPEPSPFSPETFPEPRDAISRFGRGYADAFDGLDKFEFLSFLDRFSPPTPGPEDALGLVPPIEPNFETSAFLASRLRRVFTSPLHEGFEEATRTDRVVEGIEDIPQGGLAAVETVVGVLSGEEEGLDLGELRLRTRGGLLSSPSRFVSLSYKFGFLRAELYPTRAKIRLARRFGDFRVSLRGGYHFTEGIPEAKLEISRTFGKSWRFRAIAGHGVDFFTAALLTSPPGLEEGSPGIGGLALLEYRF
jgi:hypothetical protein